MKKLTVVLIILFLSSCGSTDISRYYYAYDDPAQPEIRKQPLSHNAIVSNFRSSSWLRTRNIPVRPSPNRIDYYDEYAWISEPGELFAEYTQEILKKRNLFKTTTRISSEKPVNIMIEGYITHMEIIRSGDSLYTWLDFYLTCRDSRTLEIITSHEFSTRRNMGEDAMVSSFAAIVSDLFHSEVIRFSNKCENALEARK